MRGLGITFTLILWIVWQSPLASGQSGQLSSELQADQYLSSFKRRALDAAFESGARVKGVAYIDDQGRLHERAMFSGEADVRGVQVQSYLEAMDGEDPPLEAIQVTDEARCELWKGRGPRSGLISLAIDPDGNPEASERAIRQKQEALFTELLDAELTDAGFRVLAPVGPKPSSYQDTTYARALVGDWSGGPPADFAVSVKMVRLADDRVKDDLYMNHPGFASLVSTIRFIPRVSSGSSKLIPWYPRLTSSAAIPVDFDVLVTFSQPSAKRVLGAHRALIKTRAYRSVSSGAWIVEQDLERLKSWVSESASDFAERASCVPRLFSVKRESPSSFSVGAGFSRGINEGMWLLAGDRQLMVDGVVSDQALEALLMLKITKVDQDRAMAEPLPSGEGALVPQGELLGVLP